MGTLREGAGLRESDDIPMDHITEGEARPCMRQTFRAVTVLAEPISRLPAPLVMHALSASLEHRRLGKVECEGQIVYTVSSGMLPKIACVRAGVYCCS